MARIGTYSSQSSLQPAAYMGAEQNTLTRINDVIGPEINQMAEQVREADRKTYAQRASLDYIQKLSEIKDQVAKENPNNPETWSDLIGARASPLIEEYTGQYVSQSNRTAVQDALNRQLLSFQANAVEQADKLAQQSRLVQFEDGINKLDNTIATASPALARQLEAERMGMISSNPDLTPEMRQKLDQQYVINKAIRTKDIGLLRTAGAGLPEEKRIAIQKQIENEAKQNSLMAKQASYFERAGYEGRLVRNMPESITDQDLNSNNSLTVRDREQIRLDRDKALAKKGALPEQQAQLQERIENKTFNRDVEQERAALDFYYQNTQSVMGDDQKVALVSDTGYVPNFMANQMVSQMFSGTPEQRVQSAQLYNSINQSRPDALAEINREMPALGVQARQLDALIKGGVAPDRAVTQVEESYKAAVNMGPDRVKVISKDANVWASQNSKKVLDRINSEYDPLTFGNVKYGNGVQGQVQSFLSEYYRTAIQAGADPKMAQEDSYDVVARNFGVTETGTQKRVVFAPPEKYADIGPKKIRGNVEGIFSGSKINYSEFSIVSDPVTQRQVTSGQKPTYVISYVDDNGGFAQLPVRVNANGTLAE